jgi:hypothetical protein
MAEISPVPLTGRKLWDKDGDGILWVWADGGADCGAREDGERKEAPDYACDGCHRVHRVFDNCDRGADYAVCQPVALVLNQLCRKENSRLPGDGEAELLSR